MPFRKTVLILKIKFTSTWSLKPRCNCNRTMTGRQDLSISIVPSWAAVFVTIKDDEQNLSHTYPHREWRHQKPLWHHAVGMQSINLYTWPRYLATVYLCVGRTSLWVKVSSVACFACLPFLTPSDPPRKRILHVFVCCYPYLSSLFVISLPQCCCVSSSAFFLFSPLKVHAVLNPDPAQCSASVRFHLTYGPQNFQPYL